MENIGSENEGDEVHKRTRKNKIGENRKGMKKKKQYREWGERKEKNERNIGSVGPRMEQEGNIKMKDKKQKWKR